MSEHLRLSKLMSQRGICSRREADELIAKGLVRVNGEVQRELGVKVDPNAKIDLEPEAERWLDKKVTIILNKPAGYVSGQPEKGYRPAVELITSQNQDPTDRSQKFSPQHLKGLAPAGRLDIDSKGLLVFTQDGVLAKALIGAETKIEKEYLVRVQGQYDENTLKLLRHGLSLDGQPLKPAKVEKLNEDQLRFVLREGKKRQIRRMCEAVGLQVTGLKRVRIGRVLLGGLPEGQWRYLRSNESF